jgi:hypothetical protein
MTSEPAAIQGTFADFKIIRTRKLVQIIVELPIEQADEALRVLGGLPRPDQDQWLAVARLNGVAKPPEPEEINTKLSLQAVMRCKEPLFWRFLNTQTVQPVEDETDAAWVVRQLCGVELRSGLNTDPNAAALWRALDAKFQAWKRGME